jgi:hypothetical protein
MGMPKEGKPEYDLWTALQNREIYQYSVPGPQMAARLYPVEGGKILAGTEPRGSGFCETVSLRSGDQRLWQAETKTRR